MDPVLIGLMGFVILGSIVALETRNLLSAVIAAGVVGLGLSIIFLLLAAPDIAITQVVVEVIIVTVLIRACSRLSPESPPVKRRGRPGIVAGIGLALVFVGFVIAGLAALPEFGSATHPVGQWYLTNAPDLTGATNIVTAIILDFRAYDTLGEATVILTAVVGTVAVLRNASQTRPDAPVPEPTSEPEAPTRESAPEPREVMHV